MASPDFGIHLSLNRSLSSTRPGSVDSPVGSLAIEARSSKDPNVLLPLSRRQDLDVHHWRCTFFALLLGLLLIVLGLFAPASAVSHTCLCCRSSLFVPRSQR